MSAVAPSSAQQREADAARMHRTMMGYLGTKALLTAVELGVFDALERGPATAEEVAARAGLPQRSTRALLSALEGERLVHNDGGTYRNDSAASTFLVSGSPDNVISLVEHQNAHFAKFVRLTESLREDRPLQMPDDYYLNKPFGSDGSGYTDWADRLVKVMTTSNTLFGRLGPKVSLEGHRHMVDLGCGPCMYTIDFANAHPHLRFTAVDNGPVAERGRRNIEAAGLADRVHVRPGDIFNDRFPECDCALLSNTLQGFSQEKARGLIEHIGSWLPAGGELLIHGHLPLEAPFTYQFGLILMVNNSEGGEPHSEDLMRAWFAEAGFTSVDIVPVASIFTLARARK